MSKVDMWQEDSLLLPNCRFSAWSVMDTGSLLPRDALEQCTS